MKLALSLSSLSVVGREFIDLFQDALGSVDVTTAMKNMVNEKMKKNFFCFELPALDKDVFHDTYVDIVQNFEMIQLTALAIGKLMRRSLRCLSEDAVHLLILLGLRRSIIVLLFWQHLGNDIYGHAKFLATAAENLLKPNPVGHGKHGDNGI